MAHEELKYMKDCLTHYVKQEMTNLTEVDAKELGEAVDMIKDLAEAIYYCTITEAMHSNEDYEVDKEHHNSSRMYYEADWPDNGNYTEQGMRSKMRDYREGKSPESRRMYMEGRDSGHDKANQLRELERYMQELSGDIVEMIQEASSEEKQYLEKKLVALSSKIGQMK